jgi:hypothetical protein
MIGQIISHYELTLWSLSKVRDGRIASANISPSLMLERGTEWMSFNGGIE